MTQVNLGVVHAFCNWMDKKFREEARKSLQSVFGVRRAIVYYLAENTVCPLPVGQALALFTQIANWCGEKLVRTL
jgi:hypothetical protein